MEEDWWKAIDEEVDEEIIAAAKKLLMDHNDGELSLTVDQVALSVDDVKQLLMERTKQRLTQAELDKLSEIYHITDVKFVI